MHALIWTVLFVVLLGGLLFVRASLLIWTISAFALVIGLTVDTHSVIASSILGVACLILLIFNIRPLRRLLITRFAFKLYKSLMPAMSATEKEALEAGSVGFEGEFFHAQPDWQKLFSIQKPQLTAEEQAFLDGPTETLCEMLDDWKVTHEDHDLPPAVWQYIKEQGFFGLIIPKSYGGKEFSALLHSLVLVKLFSRSITLASTVAVPNSLGPAELLLHYGTKAQKDYYLPRLAKGEEVPCFALTSPTAGSDASSLTDHGIVCKGQFNGEEVLGIRLTWSKRYITLAPVATVLGLAFKLFDPDHLLGHVEKLGITCALIPTSTPGVITGRRHFPASSVFQNGPTQGKDVFIPLDYIIGGNKMIGQGWRMLVECLSVGRSISLPSSGVAGVKVAAHSAGAYARIRRQFNVAIGQFEGVEEKLGRIAGKAYQTDAVSKLTLSAIDHGQKPAIPSAIIKYHCTELGRQCTIDAMDVHGGKAVCLGPKNYLAGGYHAAPVGVTVEGANILTRNMIIFGQGLVRCHPYALSEMEAAGMENQGDAVKLFDKAVFSHMGFTLSNIVRSFILGLSHARFAFVPKLPCKPYLQHFTRFSSSFALMADMCMFIFGGDLKRKERVSARLGDVVSYLYIGAAVLKMHADRGYPMEEKALIQWACQDALFQIQTAFDELLLNLPNRWVAGFLRVLLFPLGKRFEKPSDRLDHELAKLLMTPSVTRDQLIHGIYLKESKSTNVNPFFTLTKTLDQAIAIEPIEKKLHQLEKAKEIKGFDTAELAAEAYRKQLISEAEYTLWKAADALRMSIIHVDDFDAKLQDPL